MKTANRPAPWPQRFLAETLAPASSGGCLALRGEAARESKEQGSSGQRERRRCSRPAGRGRGGAEAGRGAAAPAAGCGRQARWAAGRELAMRLTVRSRGADVFWAIGGLFVHFLSLGHTINFLGSNPG
jgi:hypothetical protein